MSLKKIIEIANVGRFVECKNIELSDVNLIYAENGCGKSTLSAIMRALAPKDSNIINERSTLGITKKPKVKLLFNDNDFVSFEQGAWNGDPPHFEVFDDIFVSENIYAGHEITSEHRTGLYEFAIGSLAVDLRNKEKAFDDQIEEIDSRRKKQRDTISRKIDMDFNEFIKLTVVDELEIKIRDCNNRFDAAKSNDLLQKKEKLSKLDEMQIDFDFYQQLLEKTIEDVSEQAETIVKEHIATHMQGRETENWIEKGLDFVKDENCPFCGQALHGLSIIEIYRDYFNQEYKSLIVDINAAINNLGNQISDDQLINMQGKISQNHSLIDSWQDHIAIKDSNFDFDQVKDKWQNIRGKLVGQSLQTCSSNLSKNVSSRVAL